MRVYFINPPAADGIKQVREGRCMQRAGAWTAIWTPVSLAISAALLRKEGMKVKLSDCIVEEINFPRLKELTSSFWLDLAVINTATPSIVSDLSTVEHLKSVVPDLKTAVIGIHGSALPENCFEIAPQLDFVIRGEPEYTIRDLAFAIQNKGDYSEVEGISYRKKREIIHNRERKPIEDLDELPFPAWDLIDRNRYRMPFTGRRFLLVATARGCPHRCTFCADRTYYGNRLRTRSPQKVVDELEFNKREYEIDEFLFWSESFTINRNFATSVAQEIIERNLKIRWVCNSRVDDVDKEMLKKFKEAGCWMIGYGVESGNQRVLDSVKKGTTIQQTINAVNLAKAAGLEVTAHCMVGFPEDTKETIRETIKFVKGLNIDFVQFYCAVPFPGSELFEKAKKNKWINNNNWRRFEQNYSVLDTENLKAEEIMALRREAYHQFYLRPKIIFETLKRIKSPKYLKNFIHMVKDFLTWI